MAHQQQYHQKALDKPSPLIWLFVAGKIVKTRNDLLLPAHQSGGVPKTEIVFISIPLVISI